MRLNHYHSARFSQMSPEEKNVVKAGIELFQHSLYVKDKDKYSRYEEVAKKDGKSYEEKEALFNLALKKEAFKRAGVAGSGFSDEAMLRNPNVRWALYELVSETLSIIIPETVLDQFNMFAEVRNVAWGDNARFALPSPNLFVVNKTTNGKRRGHPQRLHTNEITLTAEPHEITIAEDYYRILAGKANWGDWIGRISLSVQTKITTEIYFQLFNSYDSLGAKFKEAAFDKDAFVKLAQRVEGANGGAGVTVFGTKLALSKVVPDADFAKFGYVGIGEQYNDVGFLPRFMGVDTFLINQRILPNDPDYGFAIDDNTLYFISTGTDKPVKILFEGTPLVYEGLPEQSATLTQYYTYIQYFDAAIATSSKYGIMKISAN